MTKEERREYNRQRYLKKREQILEQQKQYYQENVDKIKQYQQTPMGRAVYLVNGYKQSDKKANRGECTLTAKWVVENIFNKPCAHCGKSGWQIIGCNRLDNSRPHTPDNVEPCCLEHNNELNYIEMSKKVYQYTKEGKLVKVWDSTMECGRNGYDQGNVSRCCNGGFMYKGKWVNCNTYKGYKWSYEPS